MVYTQTNNSGTEQERTMNEKKHYLTRDVKRVAENFDFSVSAIRDLAEDLGFEVPYDADRKTWILKMTTSELHVFADHLTELKTLNQW